MPVVCPHPTDARTADRVFLRGVGDWEPAAREYVDEDNLPKELGGRMEEEWPEEFGEAWG